MVSQTDRQTYGQTDWAIHRAAWSQLKNILKFELCNYRNKLFWCKSIQLHCVCGCVCVRARVCSTGGNWIQPLLPSIHLNSYLHINSVFFHQISKIPAVCIIWVKTLDRIAYQQYTSSNMQIMANHVTSLGLPKVNFSIYGLLIWYIKSP